MLTFECPSCQAKLQAAEKNAGKKIVCPKCQTKSTIPDPEDPDAEAITAEPEDRPAKSTAVSASAKSGSTKKRSRDDDDDDDDERGRRKKSGSGKVKAGMGIGMILLIVGGIAGCCVCVPGILVALLMPAVSKVRDAAAKTQSTNNMKQMGLAALSFHDANRSLPPPRMPNADLSWRVSVLPYIEQAGMFQQFNQNEAWNGPNNSRFTTMMPQTYLGPKQDMQERTKTNIQYFTGPNTLFPTPQTKITLMQVTDGTSNTLLFAEAQNPVTWSSPADMVVAPNGLLPLPNDTFLAGFCDGSVRFINRGRANDNVLRLLINPKDGQPIPPGAVD